MNKRAFFSICVAIFVAMLGMGIVSPLMAIYATSLGATGAQLGLMYSGYALSRAVIQPFAGWFSDRRGRKDLMVVGLFAYTVISIGYALCTNIYQLTAVRFLHGFSSAMVLPVAQAYVGDLCPKGKEDTYMGLFQMAYSLGMGVGPLLGGTISDAFGRINPAFYIMGALAGAGLVLMIIFVPQTKAHIRSKKDSVPISVMLKDNKVRAVALYLGSRGVLRQGISAFLALFATQVLGMSLTLASVAISVFIFTEAFGQGLVGAIATRFSRKMIMVAAAVIASCLVFLVGSARNFLSMIAVLIPMAFLIAMGRISALAFNVEVGAKYRRMGVGMGISNAVRDLGHFLGPMVFGWAMDRFGIGSVFSVGAIISLATVPFMTYWLLQKDTEYVPKES